MISMICKLIRLILNMFKSMKYNCRKYDIIIYLFVVKWGNNFISVSYCKELF